MRGPISSRLIVAFGLLLCLPFAAQAWAANARPATECPEVSKASPPTTDMPAKFVQSLDAQLKSLQRTVKSSDSSTESDLADTLMLRGDLSMSSTGYYASALCWYRKAAAQGNPEAEMGIGLMYLTGRGVEKNSKQGLHWYQLAAEHGSATAQSALGDLFSEGKLVERDYHRAAYWYRLAAKQGDADAQASLGWLYEKGNGVTRNRSKAIYWYTKAAKQGDSVSAGFLGKLYFRVKDYKKALYWNRKAADGGSAMGQADLGTMYAVGRGVTQD